MAAYYGIDFDLGGRASYLYSEFMDGGTVLDRWALCGLFQAAGEVQYRQIHLRGRLIE